MAGDARDRMQEVLDALGFEGDPEMASSAQRFTDFLRDWLPQPPPDLSRCATSHPGQVIALCEVPFHSLCAHHLLPFFGSVDVAYRAGSELVGLGALPRLVQWAAGRPQLQERLAQDVVDRLVEGLAPEAVLVRVRARHMCVEMRGAKSPGTALVEASHGEVVDLRAALVAEGASLRPEA